ncbi:hypothetical protein ACJX0J_029074, partial [Zea mays]
KNTIPLEERMESDQYFQEVFTYVHHASGFNNLYGYFIGKLYLTLVCYYDVVLNSCNNMIPFMFSTLDNLGYANMVANEGG